MVARHLKGTAGCLLSIVMCVGGIAYPADGTHTQVRLAHGRIGKFVWSVTARSEQSANRKRPCVATLTSTRETHVCGSLEPVPLILADSTGTGGKERTVLALAFPRRVTAVRLWLEGRRDRLVRLRLLSRRQANVTGLDSFRYAGRAYAGKFCLRRFSVYDHRLRVLDVSSHMPCGVEERTNLGHGVTHISVQ